MVVCSMREFEPAIIESPKN